MIELACSCFVDGCQIITSLPRSSMSIQPAFNCSCFTDPHMLVSFCLNDGLTREAQSKQRSFGRNSASERFGDLEASFPICTFEKIQRRNGLTCTCSAVLQCCLSWWLGGATAVLALLALRATSSLSSLSSPWQNSSKLNKRIQKNKYTYI